MTEENTQHQIMAPQVDADTDTKTTGETPSMTSEQYRDHGMAALAQSDMDAAIDFLSKALQAKIAEVGNELAPECASFYFDYGDAMLQQCSQKSDVFGGAIRQAQKQVAVEIIEETNNDESADNNDDAEADKMNDAELKDEERPETVNNDIDAVERAESEPSVADVAAAAGTADDDDDIDEGEEEGNEDAEEDIEDVDEPTDLEVAWELLETARVIYSRMDKNQPSVIFGLADCYSRLGDLALENDTDAIADYTQCLDMLKSITNNDSLSSSQLSVKYRAVGAVNFKMAIANSLTGESARSLTQFQDAQRSLVKVVEMILGQSFTSSGKSEAGSEVIPIESIKVAVAAGADPQQVAELNDIVDLLEKIQEKIEDQTVAEPMQSTEVTTIVNEIMADAAAAAGVSNGFEPSRESGGEASEPVVDLGTLIGQKRKMETDPIHDADQPAKAAKPDQA